MAMLYAAIDIQKHVFQAAVLDASTGELAEARFPASREARAEWASSWESMLVAVAIEATRGWRWVWRELSARGDDVRLAQPARDRRSCRSRIRAEQ